MKGLILIGYLAILFFIGYKSSKKVKNVSDFYVGGKTLGYWVAALSARATGESGWLLLGLTGMGALMGFKAFWVVIGEVLGVSLCWLLMAKKFKWFTDKFKSITIPDYLSGRFKSKTHLLRAISALTLGIFIAIYVSAQIDATGTAFETFFNMNYFTGAIIGFAIVLLYVSYGGFVAVAWSDVFQGAMMFAGLVILPIVAGTYFFNSGAESGVVSSLQAIDPALTQFFGEFTLLNTCTVLGFLAIGVGFLGSPQIFVRFISVRDEVEIKKGTKVAILFTILTDSAAVLAGIYGRLLFQKAGVDIEQILGNGAQNVLPLLVEHLFPTVIVGLYIATILSAIMSTVDSLLVVSSSAITHDVYQTIIRPDLKDKPLVSVSRKITIGIAVASLVIALLVAVVSPTRTIFWFVLFGWTGIAATFVPTMILSLSWKRFTEKGAIASMLGGFSSVIFFSFVGPKLAVVGPYLKELTVLPLSITMGLFLGVIVSMYQRDYELEDSYEQWNQEYHSRHDKTDIEISVLEEAKIPIETH
ncbi:sodium:proline symporter [Candidatus Marinamargulisbacteria bacterium SCGC AG-343-D04]|nr:sodium:proline symporter [Candidatus Marinamargulisbacteria bacterium SCGC AG-343-D04]